MKKEICVPELGEDITEAVVACWHVQEGDAVRTDDDVAEAVTDKATFNIAAGENGILKKILVSPGETVQIGAPIAEIEIRKDSSE
ncbi:MAG: lipoyl domain-containing protein [Candidatus Omnitrophota bacterium]